MNTCDCCRRVLTDWTRNKGNSAASTMKERFSATDQGSRNAGLRLLHRVTARWRHGSVCESVTIWKAAWSDRRSECTARHNCCSSECTARQHCCSGLLFSFKSCSFFFLSGTHLVLASSLHEVGPCHCHRDSNSASRVARWENVVKACISESESTAVALRDEIAEIQLQVHRRRCSSISKNRAIVTITVKATVIITAAGGETTATEQQ